MNNFFNIVLLGAPGSGKGTQATLISNHYQLEHISTGDMFRKEIEARSEIGMTVKKILDEGRLCPDNLTLDMLVHYLSRFKQVKGFILDGVPRTLEQAQMMDGINYGHTVPINMVLYLTVNKTEIVERLSKRAQLLNRSDDDPQIIQQRIMNYEKLTEPLVKYYSQKGILHEINGMRTVEEVFEDICNCIGK